jgi:hypothetical protein
VPALLRWRKERAIKLSTRPWLPLWFCALAVLSVGLVFPVGAAQAVPVRPIAWGCERIVPDYGWCNVPGGLTGATAIAAGDSHSLAVTSDGTVVAWGCAFGDYGQCSVPGGLSGVTAVAAGFAHSLALKSNGTVVAWGCGFPADSGQCSVPPSLSGVTAIAAGGVHSLGLKSDGTVVAWGCGGIPNSACTVPVGLSGVTAIAAGFGHSVALKGDGTVVAWGCGSGGYGQCSVPGGLSDVAAVSASQYHTLVLKSDGTVLAWGCGPGSLDFGQCSVPGGLSGVTAIAAGQAHNLALKSDGTVVAWGCGADLGQCRVPIVLCQATAIAARFVQSLAIGQFCQTIAFGPLVNRTYGGPDFTVSATASSGLAVSFAASGTCEANGPTLHITGVGSCTVTASQAGNADFNPAPDVSQTFAITKAGQTISFGPLTNKKYGAPDFRVSATASSGLPVSFAASGRCTISGATVHLSGAGSCTVIAAQPGNANYNAAPAVSRTFSIARAPCRVPKVVGKQVASAKRTIARRHCRTGKVGYAYSRKRKKGTVISQSRRPGRVLPSRSKINLVVSRGRKR